MQRSLSVFLMVLVIGAWGLRAASAQDADDVLPKFDAAGFHRVFDGKSLSGWDGDPTYWSVEDGKLVGAVTPQTLLKKNSWIVYRGELVEDFELVLDYRVSEGGNSGVGYRLAVLENDPVSVRGPQADIHGADMYTGICYEENGRRLLAARGQTTQIDPNALPRLVAQFADPAELQSIVQSAPRANGWNRYRLVVKGNDAQHFLNGVLMSEVYDRDDPNRMPRGLIGVQVHVGPPMKIEYRDLFLKHLGARPEGSAERGAVVYRPGTLREPQHAETFDHLAEEAARITAPAADQPLDGMRTLEFTALDAGIVRSDLRNVALSGGVRPLPTEPAQFDLVLRHDENTLRIPGAGNRFRGKPLPEKLQVRLVWDGAGKCYRLTSLVEGEQ